MSFSAAIVFSPSRLAEPQNHIIMKKSRRSRNHATPAGPSLYHLPADLLHDLPELCDRFIIPFRINAPQRMCLPGNLVEVIAAKLRKKFIKHRKKTRNPTISGLLHGGDKRDRTADLLNAMEPKHKNRWK